MTPSESESAPENLNIEPPTKPWFRGGFLSMFLIGSLSRESWPFISFLETLDWFCFPLPSPDPSTSVSEPESLSFSLSSTESEPESCHSHYHHLKAPQSGLSSGELIDYPRKILWTLGAEARSFRVSSRHTLSSFTTFFSFVTYNGRGDSKRLLPDQLFWFKTR